MAKTKAVPDFVGLSKDTHFAQLLADAEAYRVNHATRPGAEPFVFFSNEGVISDGSGPKASVCLQEVTVKKVKGLNTTSVRREDFAIITGRTKKQAYERAEQVTNLLNDARRKGQLRTK